MRTLRYEPSGDAETTLLSRSVDFEGMIKLFTASRCRPYQMRERNTTIQSAPREVSRRQLLGTAGSVLASATAGCLFDGDDPLELSAPAERRRDRPVDIDVSGVPDGELVTLRAVYRSPGIDEPLESYASFRAGDGHVDLSEPPEEGTYSVGDPMGLFWSKQLRSALEQPSEYSLPEHDSEERGVPVLLVLETDGETLRHELQVYYREEGVTESQVDADGVVGTYHEPSGSTSGPALLNLHGSDGGDFSDMGALFAGEGYPTLTLQYIDTERESLPDEAELIPLDYFDRAIEWLLNRQRVDGRLGIHGHSIGMTIGLILATRREVVETVAGTNGFDFVTDFGGGSILQEDGEPLEALAARPVDTERTQRGRQWAPAWQTRYESLSDERREAVTIPVEEVDASVLLITGEDDALVPSTAAAERIVGRLEAHENTYSIEHRSYTDAGHVILSPYRPTQNRDFDPANGWELGGTTRGAARADEQSWERRLSWFDDHL